MLKKEIFETQPASEENLYTFYMNKVKNYTQNIQKHLDNTIEQQNKSITRKRIELQNELQFLKDKFHQERKRITQMEQYFVQNCQKLIKKDINKWEQNQTYFNKLFQAYQTQINIQRSINKTKQTQIDILKHQVKQNLRSNIKSKIAQKYNLNQKYNLQQQKFNLQQQKFNLQQKQILNKPLNRKIKSLSSVSFVKMKTQASQTTLGTSNVSNHALNIKKKMQKQPQNISCQKIQQSSILSQSIPIRMRTQVSLPSLKKPGYNLLDESTEANFMKPIHTIKKIQQKSLTIPLLIQFLKEHYQSSLTHDQNWFDKVVFTKRNFQKIINKLQHDAQIQYNSQFNHNSKTKSSHNPKTKSSSDHKTKSYSDYNKVIQIKAKNLFRLKTQSSTTKFKSLSILQNHKSKLFK